MVDPSGVAGSAGVAVEDAGARRRVAVDLAILIAFMVTLHLITFSITERYAGPITALCTVALIAALLRWRGMRWRDIGVRRPTRPWWLFLQVPVVLVAWLGASLGAAAIVGRFLQRPEASARFGNLAGNLPATLWWIAIALVVGGFAEEVIFRGFLLNRLEALLPRGAAGSAAAVLVQSFLFGAAHAYNRGLFGLLVLGTVGAVLAVSYLLLRRNLWPVILAHGLGDTLGFIARYSVRG